MTLRVELYGIHVGDLVGESWRTFDFAVAPDAFDHFDVGSDALSLAIPLVPVALRARAAVRRNFFDEILPEGDQLAWLARQAGVVPNDTIALLGRYGRDVAGALQIWDPEGPGEPPTPTLSRVDDRQIAELLAHGPDYPLGNIVLRGKTSLAGVQPKLLLARDRSGWNQVFGGAPSTHILKPQLATAPTMIFDEEYGSRLARALGLLDYATQIVVFAGMPTLVIERYDRAPGGVRVHQEDAAQALGVNRDRKYQRQGGGINLARIAKLFTQRADPDSARRLLQRVTLAVAVGDLDVHAKNVSILHPAAGRPTLAPAYDVVPQTHLETDGELAMAVNGVYRHAAVTADDLIAEGSSWGLPDADRIVTDALERILPTAMAETPALGAYPTLQDDVVRFTGNLLAGSRAGLGPRPD